MALDDLHPETLAISCGRPPHLAGEGINLPISLNSTFVAGGPINYGRTGNETWQPLEDAISALEEATSTLLFSSGMSAITAVFSLLPHGAPVVASHYDLQLQKTPYLFLLHIQIQNRVVIIL